MKNIKGIYDGEIIFDNIKIADSFLKRLVGLLAKKKIDEREGLLINRCKQVHTFGMKFNIDAVFLSIDGEVLHIESDLPKNKISKNIRKATCVLELKAGVTNKYNIKRNDFILFKAQ